MTVFVVLTHFGVIMAGGGKPMSASERLKQKKLALKNRGKEDNIPSTSPSVSSVNSSEQITKLTEVCNDILTSTGNMGIYEETYESIMFKVLPASFKLFSYYIVLIMQLCINTSTSNKINLLNLPFVIFRFQSQFPQDRWRMMEWTCFLTLSLQANRMKRL